MIRFLLILILATPAFAQGHSNHPPKDQALHETFYSTWLRPDIRVGVDRTASCCNDKDCYPTLFKKVGGTWFAQRREDREWIAVPAAIIEQNQPDERESPDGQSHVCMQPPNMQNKVFCATLGTGT